MKKEYKVIVAGQINGDAEVVGNVVHLTDEEARTPLASKMIVAV